MRFFKVIHSDNSIGLFHCNDQKAIDVTIKCFSGAGARVIEISREEYIKIDKEIDNE